MSGEEQMCMDLCMAILDKDYYNEMFIPRYMVKKRYCKNWHDKIKVMFPGYVFIDSDKENMDKMLRELWKVPRLTKMLKNADQVSPITEEEQHFLQNLMDDEYMVRYSEGFIVGDRVCITEGALRDMSGYIKKVDRHRRLAFLDINFLGRETPVEVGLSAVARVTDEEFERIRQLNIMEHEAAEPSTHSDGNETAKSEVLILSGMFSGMYGEFRSADTDKDEWTVLIKMFGDEPSKVVFHREEIKML